MVHRFPAPHSATRSSAFRKKSGGSSWKAQGQAAMGSEARCTARVKGRMVAGKARLETEVLEFRSADLKLSIPFKSVKKISVSGDALNIDHTEGRVTLDVGANASRWAEKILHPPSRAQKLGVQPDWTASAIGVDDEQFLKELDKSVASLSIG